MDPRVTRTKKLLMHALIELVVEKEVEKITIRDIVKKAEINRSTFYLHFQDKQDILDTMTEEILLDLTESLNNPPDFNLTSALQHYRDNRQPIASAIKLFAHIEKYSALYKKMLHEMSFRERVVHTFKTHIHQNPEVDEAVISFAIHGIVGLILYWVDNGMKESVEEISLLQTRLALALESFT